MRGLLEDLLLYELERPPDLAPETIRRNPVDGGRPAVRHETEAGEHRLPAFGRERLVFHGRDIPSRPKGGDLVRKRLRYRPAASLLPEFATEGCERIEGTLKITYALVV